MAKFLTDLVVREITDDLWELVEPLMYDSDLILEINVPPKFTTDFGSVPRFPILYASLGNLGNKSSCIHDYLYTNKPCDRKTADRILLEALRVEGVDWLRRTLIYLGVRIGGRSHW